jgi:outer membrane protein assembly factor BamB
MVAVDEKTGERIWTRNIAGTQAPAVAGETVYVVSLTGQLIALARDSGKVRWLTKLPGDSGVRWTGPVIAGGRLWLSSSAKTMVAVDATTGQVAGTYELGAESHVAPIVASGGLFLLLDNGNLTAFF